MDLQKLRELNAAGKGLLAAIDSGDKIAQLRAYCEIEYHAKQLLENPDMQGIAYIAMSLCFMNSDKFSEN